MHLFEFNKQKRKIYGSCKILRLQNIYYYLMHLCSYNVPEFHCLTMYIYVQPIVSVQQFNISTVCTVTAVSLQLHSLKI